VLNESTSFAICKEIYLLAWNIPLNRVDCNLLLEVVTNLVSFVILAILPRLLAGTPLSSNAALSKGSLKEPQSYE
jgi:hypothetical protein